MRTRIAEEWTPLEFSIVALGADHNAHWRSLDETAGDRATINRSIRDLARRAGAPLSVADALIDRAAGIDEAYREIGFAIAARGVPIRASVGTDYASPDHQTRVLSDTLYAKMTGTAPQGAARERMHRSMIDLMADHLRATGVHLRNEAPAEVYQQAMLTRAAGMHAATDFPIVLADTMNRRLGELFKAAESGASAIVAHGTARDFRPITEARVTSFPSLELLSESADIKFGSLDEAGEVLAIASYARAIAISFKTLVNDDMGAIDRSIRDVAFATAQLKAKLIVAALAASLRDGKALFHADHGNLADTGAAPGETPLSNGRIGMMKQTPPGSTEPLGLSPSILLVPAELQTASEKLVTSINPTVTDDVNVFAGRLQVAVEPRLPDVYGWYLFASPGTYPVLRFLTLAGFDGPRFETQQEFSRLGTSFRVHWHVGAGPIDWRGAWKNAGH